MSTPSKASRPVTARIANADHDALRDLAKRRGTTVSASISEAVRTHLAKVTKSSVSTTLERR